MDGERRDHTSSSGGATAARTAVTALQRVGRWWVQSWRDAFTLWRRRDWALLNMDLPRKMTIATQIGLLLGAVLVVALPLSPSSGSPSDATAAGAVATVAPVSQSQPATTPTATPKPAATAEPTDVPLPADVQPYEGHHVVFSLSAGRVWLVDGEDVVSTYRASGSAHDNLKVGEFTVYARQRSTVAYDYKSTMEYMVTFTTGVNAPIGFHSIPVDRDTGAPIMSEADLGKPLSSGCIRQKLSDAKRLWDFAPMGTPVSIVA